MKAFLFGTEPADPLVFAVTLVGLAAAGILAAVAPARRAAHGEVRSECVAQHVDTGPRQLRAAVGAHYLTTGTKLTR